MRLVIMGLVVAALLGFTWVFSLPSKAECIASGRIVDPTERHCESGGGYQQLEEHALFHTRDLVFPVAFLLAAVYVVRRYRRPRAPQGPPVDNP